MKKVIVLITAFAFSAAFAIAQSNTGGTGTSGNSQNGSTTQPSPATPSTPQTQPSTPSTTPSSPYDRSHNGTYQNGDQNYNRSSNQSNVSHAQKDGIVFRDGKVYNVKGGKSTAITKETTLSNGTKIKTDGTVVMKDGTQTTLSEGDYISMDGNLERAKPNRMGENNMDNDKKDKDQDQE